MKGVVRKVDAGSGEVTIAHEAIPGFMPKMTMPFTAEGQGRLLDDVRPGDEVEGPLRVDYEGGEVKEMALVDLPSPGRPRPKHPDGRSSRRRCRRRRRS